MAFAAYPALLRAKVDAATALEQLRDYIQSSSSFSSAKSAIDARRADLVEKHERATGELLKLEELPEDDVMTSSFIVGAYRRITDELQVKSLVCNEAISKCVALPPSSSGLLRGTLTMHVRLLCVHCGLQQLPSVSGLSTGAV